jgi:deoxycytidine triphosphate deaminase
VQKEKASKITELAAKIDYECRGHKASAGILCDAQIRWRVREQDMISPCLLHSINEYGVSAGITHHGYDARLGKKFKTFHDYGRKYRRYCTTKNKLIDAVVGECHFINDVAFEENQVRRALSEIIRPGITEIRDSDFAIDELDDGDEYILWPGTAVLGHTLEYFRIPNDIHCTVVGKSTLARLFVHPMVTPLEAGWEGQATLEIVNLGNRPVALTPGMGIVQVEFHAVDFPDQSYADKKGKYQKQTGVEVAKW